jgi:transcription factor STE12
MAIMDYHSAFDIYSAPSSTRSSPPEYDPYPQYTTHYPQQPLQVLTDGPQDHDPADYTAHPNRPHTYQFRINEHHHRSSSSEDDYDRSGEILPNCVGFNRPLNHHEQERIAHLDRLKFFLATAPSRWDATSNDSTDTSMMATPTDVSDLSSSMPPGHPSSSHPALNRFLLPTSEYVSCVLWNSLYHITGTDIVRALVFRFEAFGRPVRNMKKFEEGIFSDLRNLKPGVDACLEEPKVSLPGMSENHVLRYFR